MSTSKINNQHRLSTLKSSTVACPSCIWILSLTVLLAFSAFLFYQTVLVEGFIKFGYVLNTTACDICDEFRTYSGRNVFCCLSMSKCCGPNSLDELDALTSTPAP